MATSAHWVLLPLAAVLASACAETSRPQSAGSNAPEAPRPPAVSATAVPAPPPMSAAPPPAPAASSAPALRPAAIPDDMLGVPGGTFTMGLDEKGEMDERPAHQVTVRPFLLEKTEVSNQAYYRCVDANGCRPPSPPSARANKLGDDKLFRRPQQPISGISQSDAAAYCQWLGRRLPTEAEWERAARGSDGRTYPWGNEKPTSEHAVFRASATEDVGTHPKGAGPYGHLDLAGNVWEWVADRYDPYAYKRSTAAQGIPGSCEQILETQAELKRNKMQGYTGSNPIPDECEFVLRGGAFNYGDWGLRASNRVHHAGTFRLVMSGFRCAMDWPDGPAEDGSGK